MLTHPYRWHHYHRYSHENSIKVTVIGKKGEVDFKKVRQIIKENADCVIAKRKLHKENVRRYIHSICSCTKLDVFLEGI